MQTPLPNISASHCRMVYPGKWTWTHLSTQMLSPCATRRSQSRPGANWTGDPISTLPLLSAAPKSGRLQMLGWRGVPMPSRFQAGKKPGNTEFFPSSQAAGIQGKSDCSGVSHSCLPALPLTSWGTLNKLLDLCLTFPI